MPVTLSGYSTIFSAVALPIPSSSTTTVFGDGGGVAAHHRQALVELLAELRDLFGVLRLLLGAPAVGHRREQGDERGRRGQEHPLLDAPLDQRPDQSEHHVRGQGVDQGLLPAS